MIPGRPAGAGAGAGGRTGPGATAAERWAHGDRRADMPVVGPRRAERREIIAEAVLFDMPALPAISGAQLRSYTTENKRWRVNTTTFHYQREADLPYLPEDVTEAFKQAILQRLRVPGAFKGRRLEVQVHTGVPGDLQERTFTIKWANRDDYDVPGGSWAEVWQALRQSVDRADHYDALEGTDYADEHPRGAGIPRAYMDNFRVTVKDKRPIAMGCPGTGAPDARWKNVLIDPATTVGLCGQACLAYHEAGPKLRENMRQAGTGSANKHARRIADEIGVHGPMGLADFQLYADRRPHARILVYGPGNELLLDTGRKSLTPDNIYLFFHADHCRFINPLKIAKLYETTLSQQLKWCPTCMATYTEKRGLKHFCGMHQCPGCPAKFVDLEALVAHSTPTTASCPGCRQKFRFGGCVAAHRCIYGFCAECDTPYRLVAGRPHACGLRYCKFCSEAYGAGDGHRCHLLPVAQKKVGVPLCTCYALDFECTVDAEGSHSIALAVISRVREDDLPAGEAPTWYLQGREAVIQWIGAHCHEKAVVVAHNGGQYDFVLILGAILEGGVNQPQKVIFAGEKIMCLKYQNLTFVDSRRHVAGSLEGLARTFGVAGLTKGHFPYRFFTPENLHYVGDVPGVEWFEPRSRGSPDFAEWHARIPAGGYDIFAECMRYCANDVALLATSIEAYRRSAVATCGIDPLESITIASYALKVYRALFMPPKSIVVLSPAEQDFIAPALKGGRTDALQLDRSWTPEEVAAGRYASYVDVNSLYPTVQAFDTLPGEVVSGVESFEPPLEGAAALAYLEALRERGHLAILDYSIVPPRTAHIPVLLTRSAEGRLLAAVEPIAAGRDTSVEIDAAVEAGYTGLVLRGGIVFEARRDLFAGYVAAYTALKERHSPGGAEPNEGKRAVAKLMLNSLWGKLAQQGRDKEHRYIRELREWDSLVDRFQSGDINLTLKASTPEWALAEIEAPAARERLLHTTNVAVACFVTSHARLRLYREMAKLGPRVIYHDTDSIIYERDPLGYNVPTGPGLGEWKDETGGVPITEIVCLGPKTYAFRTAAGDTTARCKGFPSDWGHLEMYRTILDAALAGAPVRMECTYTEFSRRTKVTAPVITTAAAKRFLQFEYIKRHIVSRSLTLPLGHEDIIDLDRELLRLLGEA